MDLEIHVLVTVAADIFQFQHDLAVINTWLSFRVFLGHLTADHQLDQLIHGRFRRDQSRYVLSIADNLDTVAQAEDLFQSVGNVNDGYTLFTEKFHYLEHILHFVGCQRSAWLIHDQYFRILLNGLGNLDHLLISNREVLNQFPGIDLDLELVKCLRSLCFHRFSVDHDTITDRTSQKQIFSCRQLAHIVELLIDDRDSVFSSQLRGHTVKFFSVDFNLSARRNNSSGTALDQR